MTQLLSLLRWALVRFNSLGPIADTCIYICHGLSITLWEFILYMRGLILGDINQYMVSAFLSCFLLLTPVRFADHAQILVSYVVWLMIDTCIF